VTLYVSKHSNKKFVTLITSVIFITGAVFEPSSARIDSEKVERKKAAYKNLLEFLRPFLEKPLMLGNHKYEKGVKLVFDSVQNPVINKQVRRDIFLLKTIKSQTY